MDTSLRAICVDLASASRFFLLQKIHNVNVFLNALKERDVLVEGIKGKISGSYQREITFSGVWNTMANAPLSSVIS